ncbi:hypothetical protein GF351_01280 [Candidatus Woesearchaeota archaeon]|nr:hypothetical protein [Candidatus Woesearchaeota archaeon]
MLDRIVEKVKRYGNPAYTSARRLATAAALAAAGCSTTTNVVDIGIPRKGSAVSARAGIRGGISLNIMETDIPEEARTVHVHPADGGPERGKVVMPNQDQWFLNLGLGIESSIGTDYLRLKGGIDGRLNPVQASDTLEKEWQDLPPPYKSGAYSFLESDLFSPIPFVGVEATVFDRLSLLFEYGWPQQQFEYHAGHDRFGIYWPVTVARSDPSGQSMTAAIYYHIKDKFEDPYIGITFTREKFDFKDLGTEIDVQRYALFLGANF